MTTTNSTHSFLCDFKLVYTEIKHKIMIINENTSVSQVLNSIKKDINSEKRLIKSILKRKKLTVKEKNKVYQFIKDNDGFDYAKNVMLNYKNKALKILESFPDNESKQSLRILLDYIIDRKY